MEMKNYIFLTAEGFTFQPNSDRIEPDIENLQVIGLNEGRNCNEAFRALLEENVNLRHTSFNEIFSFELSENYRKNKSYHYLKNIETRNKTSPV